MSGIPCCHRMKTIKKEEVICSHPAPVTKRSSGPCSCVLRTLEGELWSSIAAPRYVKILVFGFKISLNA